MTWDGKPKNPERDGWHFLRHSEDLRAFPCAWDATHAAWCGGVMHSPQGIIDLGYSYLGPCLTPAEVAAAVLTERAACAAILDNNVVDLNHGGRLMPPPPNHPDVLRGAYSAAIRARPAPAGGDALVAALAQAQREGIEAAANVGFLRPDTDSATEAITQMRNAIRALLDTPNEKEPQQ